MRILPLASALLALSMLCVGAEAQNRIAIQNRVAPARADAVDLGPAPPDRLIPEVRLRFKMSATQSADLDSLLADQQNPASPRFHQWLTPEQFATRFSPSDVDFGRISFWLQAQGLAVAPAGRSRGSVGVSGTVAQIAAAFGTSLHLLRADGDMHIVNVTQATLPVEFAGMIAGVTGLDDFRLKPSLRAHAEPAYTSVTTGSHYLAPGDLYTVYDVNPLLNGAINGAGVTIAVLGQTDISLADVAAFRAAAGLAANVPAVKLFGSDPGTSAADIDEAQLDVEWAGALAPAATILYINSTDVLAGSLTQAVENDVAPILSLSYGGCESGFGGANILIYQQLLRQASAQGQTVVGAAGDSGATACDYQAKTASAGLAVYFPASSPNVTAVGGTMFNENGGTFWSAANGSGAGSALSYIPETVWNETATLATLAAGGGGASAYFTKPPFQSGTGVPNDASRDLPDVALAAGSAHDGYLFCSQGFCTNGFRNAAGALDVSGGTTVATPVFAGILALVEQKIKASLGNANPVLYGLANSSYSAAVFHDITAGNNASSCVAGTTNCAGGGAIGYSAATGYDLASGLGSVDAYRLASDWLLVAPSGAGSALGQNSSATTLSAAAGSVVAGASLAISVKVVSATANLTAIPTGAVQLLVDNVPSGGTITLSGGAVGVSFSTAGLAPGAHVLTAAYSGDTTYAGSKSAVALTVVTSTAGDFTLTPTSASTSVASGGTAPGVTFSVAPVNGFTGNVAFSASATTASLGATYSFNVDPVVVSTASGGSTVLTLLAYVPQGQVSRGLFQQAESRPLGPIGWSFALAALGFTAFPRRRRRWALLPVALLALLPMLSFSGCASNSSGGSTVKVTPTPSGTYTIVVTATGTNSAGTPVTHNANVTLTVQ